MPRVLAERDGEPQLERHIESRRRRRRAVERHTRQIMERVPTGTKQLNDPVEPPLTARQLYGRPRRQTERAQTRDEREIQPLVATVVRDVKEGVVARVQRLRFAFTFPRLAA